MKKISLCLVGANGRMGQEIQKLLVEHKNISPAVAVSKQTRTQGFKKTCHSFSEVSCDDIDVIIDFSSPEMLRSSLSFAAKNKIPIIVGVTGLNTEDLRKMKQYAKKTALLFAPNMSMGVALLRSVFSLLSQVKNFDFQIIEAHHKHKKDSPSGTAISLQSSLEKVIGKKIPAPLSIRAGGIIGEHEILIISNDEKISFKHTALNRSVFAQGALRAAEWIVNCKSGFYSMEDVLRR